MKKISTSGQGREAPASLPATDARARQLSAILNNPTCPARIYNAIAEELCDMSAAIDYHTPEMIARSIAAYDRREAKRQTGGAK